MPPLKAKAGFEVMEDGKMTLGRPVKAGDTIGLDKE